MDRGAEDDILAGLQAGSVPEGVFSLRLDGLTGESGRLLGLEGVRHVPGKRLVCRGSWEGREVFAKLYFGGRRAKKNWRLEVEGIEALHRHAILAPVLLHSGTAEQGRLYVVLLAPVPRARSFKEVWEECQGQEGKSELLRIMIETVARHHSGGLLQRDLHLKNFLFSDGRLYTLDGGDIERRDGAVPVKEAVANLGLLFAQFPPGNDGLVPFAFSHYLKARSLGPDASLKALLLKNIETERKKRFKRYLKKIFRECTEFVCKGDAGRLAIYRRSEASPELEELLADPEKSRKTGGIARGGRISVWTSRLGERKVVVKRFGGRWFRLGLKSDIFRSGAAREWKRGHYLLCMGRMTPRPLALVEFYRGPVGHVSYLITEFPAHH